MLDRLFDMRGGGVVMAGKHDATLMTGDRDRHAVGRRVPYGLIDAPVAEFLELQLGKLELALVVIGVGFEIDELPLTRRVIHQRCQANAFVFVEKGETFEAIRRRDFAAQMDEMIGAQPVIAHAILDRIGKLAHFQRGHVRILVEADAQCIKDSGDAGRRDLCVMRQHRGKRVPAYLGARRVVALEVVGMQFDQPGYQEVAAHVLADTRSARDVGDEAVADRQRATLDDFVGQDDARVVKDQFGRHFKRTSCGDAARSRAMNGW